MDVINNENQIDRLSYIVYNNPTGVQKVLYEFGLPAADSLDNLYDLAQKMLTMYPESNPKLYGVHPDKDYIIGLFGQGKKFSVCNLCKSNFTQTDAESYKKEWEGKGEFAIKDEYERLRELYTSVRVVNNPDAEEQRGEITSKQNILINLLGEDSMQVSGGATGPSTTVSESTTSTSSGNSASTSVFDSLSKSQKIMGALALIALAGLAIHHFAKK